MDKDVVKTTPIKRAKKVASRTGFKYFIATTWRPLVAFTYIIICLYDFIIGPTLFNVLQYMNPGQSISAYTSITLQGSGLFHLSFGAIIGVSAHGRTKEKLNIVDIEK